MTEKRLPPDQAMAGVISRMLNRPVIEDDSLRNFGFDSNAIIEIIMQVEEQSGLQFDARLCDFEGWKQMATAFVSTEPTEVAA